MKNNAIHGDIEEVEKIKRLCFLWDLEFRKIDNKFPILFRFLEEKFAPESDLVPNFELRHNSGLVVEIITPDHSFPALTENEAIGCIRGLLV